jgi:pimeloyl-ACP methyl ester carboxylesterase
MIRLCSYLWPFTCGVRLGWLTAGYPNPPARKVRDRVFFFRGQAVTFSNGFGTLCGVLRRAGCWAEDLRCVGHRWACRELLRAQNAKQQEGRVIFIGHSAGGRYALFAAEQLQKCGVSVDLLVGLDVALPDPVPGNVKKAVHCYLSGLRLYPARPFTPAPNSAARIENFDLNAADSPISGRWLSHLSITDSPAVQELVLNRITQTLRFDG